MARTMSPLETTSRKLAIKGRVMSLPETNNGSPIPPPSDVAGETALQVLEILMLRLIDRQIIAADDLVAELESLAYATRTDTGSSTTLTVKDRLAVLANSLSAHQTSRAE